MARWVKSFNNMRIFKTTATPTAADGLTVGDLWLDINSGAVLKVCTALGPVVFDTIVDSVSPSFTTPVLGAASATSLDFTSTAGLIGTTTNDSADTGSVGELVTATAGSTSISNTTAKNVTSISLTAGDWDVWGIVSYNKATSTSMTQLISWTSETSATLPAVTLRSESRHSATNPDAASAANLSLHPPALRYSLAGTTTVYLSAYAAFTVSTMTVTGTIIARRIR